MSGTQQGGAKGFRKVWLYRMKKDSIAGVKKIAVRQWKNNFPLWLSGTAASAILVCVSMCLAFQEKNWHVVLIVICTCIALFLIGKRTVCPNQEYVELLKAGGMTQEQIGSIMRYQMIRMFLAAVPAGVLMGLIARPFLPWA